MYSFGAVCVHPLDAARCHCRGGLFCIALYTSDAFVDPTPEFWLDIKQRYIRGSWLEQRRLEAWYILRFQIGYNPIDALKLVRNIAKYRDSRGMAFYNDVKDWLGGWPMEFSSIADVKRVCGEEPGFTLQRIKDGEANTEYRFARPASGRRSRELLELLEGRRKLPRNAPEKAPQGAQALPETTIIESSRIVLPK